MAIMALILLRPEVSCSKHAEGGGPRCPFSGDEAAGVDFGRGGVGEGVGKDALGEVVAFRLRKSGEVVVARCWLQEGFSWMQERVHVG